MQRCGTKVRILFSLPMPPGTKIGGGIAELFAELQLETIPSSVSKTENKQTSSPSRGGRSISLHVYCTVQSFTSCLADCFAA